MRFLGEKNKNVGLNFLNEVKPALSSTLVGVC